MVGVGEKGLGGGKVGFGVMEMECKWKLKEMIELGDEYGKK